MRVHFCGTRGSTPVSGAGQARYGGNTSCVGLAHDGQPPTVVLDAGTGLQQLPRALGGRAMESGLTGLRRTDCTSYAQLCGSKIDYSSANRAPNGRRRLNLLESMPRL